jgi:hypothetical protein
MDLDDTIVIRSKGPNFVNDRVKKLLVELDALSDVIVLPNTGRDLYGFKSFTSQVVPLNNAVLGSGSIVVIENISRFNPSSIISPDLIGILARTVEDGTLPYLDASWGQGRGIFIGPNDDTPPTLKYSQTPSEWFMGSPPPFSQISQIRSVENIFRIEFPVHSRHTDLFFSLSQKSPESIGKLSSLVGKRSLAGYTFHSKAYFKDEYKKDYVFGRLERSHEFVNKGIGLRLWMEQSGYDSSDSLIIHVGDRDSGIVNDTRIKDDVPSAYLVMVGEKCQLGNPLVDLYLQGDPEVEMEALLKLILSHLTK